MVPGLERSQKMSRCGLGGALEKKGKEDEWGLRPLLRDFPAPPLRSRPPSCLLFLRLSVFSVLASPRLLSECHEVAAAASDFTCLNRKGKCMPFLVPNVALFLIGQNGQKLL